ncbi:DUF2007 domain-containing protein [Endozoicomonas gorgoniicola]|uniref:DUF2007 domain-containing protein n=1 Tax=Endozoicomonas gorgoniicola TaxID=1234144 RepID=A0ABT3MVF8_9GAMM|nr:DUF2007 domain-containing protein [Endozoicomonas gorgoniicola]MCW7553355.1 DUF2007 domain-containing protein [Endozoicomonas gorgoniicola]
MIKIYSPENVIEAQCLKDFLEQQHIPCFIGGQYLAGAIGELPVAGLLGLYVEDMDAGLARRLICDYLNATPVF